MIGDGETDIETAIAAGVKPVAVLWGFRSKKELRKARRAEIHHGPFRIES